MTSSLDHRLCVAPMMDWSDRHCRYFHRQLTRSALLYTEMVTTGALLRGDAARHLDFDVIEHPVALQLGGSDAAELAHCARLGERWGYDEINLNCGCPSERVQSGAFGACLMAEPELVADCVKAMCDAVSIPVTVKHRIGIDKGNDYGFVCDFVGNLADAGCKTFIVHARNAWLKGLSPRENREVPPLRYDMVYRLKRDFPQHEIVLNGGFSDHAAIDAALEHVDGVMIGRTAYHDPFFLAQVDQRWGGTASDIDRCAGRVTVSRADVADVMTAYATVRCAQGEPLRTIVRHMLGLYQGMPGARTWRRTLSDATLLRDTDASLIGVAKQRVEAAMAAADAAARTSRDARIAQAGVDAGPAAAYFNASSLPQVAA